MINQIYIENEIRDHPRSLAILNRFPRAEIIECDRYSEVFNPKAQNFRLQKTNPALILAKKHNAFVLPTPSEYGVGGDRNYYFSHMLNCIYDCRYCFLQGMYQSANYLVFVNYEDFTDSILSMSENDSGKQPWFFSGYDCDSLAFEPITGFIDHCLDVFEKIPQSWLEVRTKSTQIRCLLNRQVLDNVVIAFSFTPNDFSTRFENGVPSVEKRIQAMRKLQKSGWKIGLRFDPMMAYKNYTTSYKELFDAIFSSVDHHLIHSVSMGEFRMPKQFYKNIKKMYPDEALYQLPMTEANGMTSFAPSLESKMLDFCRQQLLSKLPEEKIFHCSI